MGNSDNRRWVCQQIARDAETDVLHFEGAPFNGRTVAEYLANQGAMIAALAKIIESLLPVTLNVGHHQLTDRGF